MNAVSPSSDSTRHTWLPSAARPSVHTARSGKLYRTAGNVPSAAEEQGCRDAEHPRCVHGPAAPS